MTIIDRYLKRIQKQESIFPMDSLHSGKLPNKKVIYGKTKSEEDEENTDIEHDLKGN